MVEWQNQNMDWVEQKECPYKYRVWDRNVCVYSVVDEDWKLTSNMMKKKKGSQVGFLWFWKLWIWDILSRLSRLPPSSLLHCGENLHNENIHLKLPDEGKLNRACLGESVLCGDIQVISNFYSGFVQSLHSSISLSYTSICKVVSKKLYWAWILFVASRSTCSGLDAESAIRIFD